MVWPDGLHGGIPLGSDHFKFYPLLPHHPPNPLPTPPFSTPQETELNFFLKKKTVMESQQLRDVLAYITNENIKTIASIFV